jgi:hypothetical protein
MLKPNAVLVNSEESAAFPLPPAKKRRLSFDNPACQC